MAERTAQRRFLALKVGEVSLVDSPANEEEFIVLKRRDPEENIMADVSKNQTPAPAATTTEAPAPEVVPVPVTKSGDSDTAKALATVEKMSEIIAKMVGAQAPAAEADVAKAKAEKAKKAYDDMTKKLAAAGLTGKALEKAAKAAMDAEDAAEGPEPADKVKKSADAPDEDADTAVTKTLEALLETIQKAKSFTPKRESALKSAVEQLQKLLGEMTTVPMNSTPNNSLPSGSTVPSGLVSVQKQMEDLISTLKSSFDNVEKGVTAISGRVEAIEKARNPSQSESPAGGTDVKVQKGFWNGLL